MIEPADSSPPPRSEAEPDVTQILHEVVDGHESASERLLPLVYDEMRAIAVRAMRQERADHTLQPTALVHEAYLKLLDQTVIPWSDAAHFRAIASRAMRQVLVDHARKRGAIKRGGDRLRVTLDIAAAMSEDRVIDVLVLDEALTALAELHERKARVVELIFFGGMTHEEAARVVGVSKKTIEADWYMARAWLGERLGAGEA